MSQDLKQLSSYLEDHFNADNRDRIYFKAYINIIVLFIYSTLYKTLSDYSEDNTKITGLGKIRNLVKFNKKLNGMDSLYFSAVSHSTVGYGDIYPVGFISRLINWSHLFITSMILISPDIRKVNKNVVIIHISSILFFSFLYWYTSRNGAEYVNPNDNKELKIEDSIQLALSNQTTVGYGSIYPTNKYGKILNIVQICYTIIILTSFS